MATKTKPSPFTLPRAKGRRSWEAAKEDADRLTEETGHTYGIIEIKGRMYRAMPVQSVWAEDERTAALVDASRRLANAVLAWRTNGEPNLEWLRTAQEGVHAALAAVKL